MPYGEWLPKAVPTSGAARVFWKDVGEHIDSGRDLVLQATKARFPDANIHRLDIKITTGGAIGTMRFQVSMDRGAYDQIIPSVGSAPFTYKVPGTGVTLSFAAGTYVLNDVYTVNGTTGAVTHAGGGPAGAVTITSNSEALNEIGDDRQLPRGVGESDYAYAPRLKGAWETWTKAGSHHGMLLALKHAGLPGGSTGVTIVQHNGRYAQLDGSDALVLGDLLICINRCDLLGANIGTLRGWMDDWRDHFYSYFAIVLPADVASLTAGSALAARVHAVAKKWRPAKTHYVGVFVLVAGRMLGWPLTGQMSTMGNLGTHTVRYLRPPGGPGIGYTAPP